MKNIVLVRIDERLIHGQVMTRIVRDTHFDTIEIVDDKISKDSFLKQVTTMAVPKEFKGLVHSVEEAADFLLGESEGESLLLLVKTPEPIEQLLEKGVKLSTVNLGGMGAKPGRKTVMKSISISPEEIETLKRIEAQGINVYAQIVPGDKKLKIEDL